MSASSGCGNAQAHLSALSRGAGETELPAQFLDSLPHADQAIVMPIRQAAGLPRQGVASIGVYPAERGSTFGDRRPPLQPNGGVNPPLQPSYRVTSLPVDREGLLFVLV